MAWLKTIFKGNDQEKDSITSSLDLVIRSAELASNPDEIDQMLDNIRRITSAMTSGQSLSAENEQIVLNVYLQLERYLTTVEPIRSFTKEELRARCSDDLLEILFKHETAHSTYATSSN